MNPIFREEREEGRVVRADLRHSIAGLINAQKKALPSGAVQGRNRPCIKKDEIPLDLSKGFTVREGKESRSNDPVLCFCYNTVTCVRKGCDMQLGQLLQFLEDTLQPYQSRVTASYLGKEVTGITADSRQVTKGSLFVALKGEHVDGHQFIGPALKAGAIGVVVEDLTQVPVGLLDTYPVFKTQSSSLALGVLANKFYGKSGTKLLMVGVTGTNGKTTVSHLLDEIFHRHGQKMGLLGTLGFKPSGASEYIDAKYTTPMATDFHARLQQLVQEHYDGLVMEVSSHALDQERVYGADFDVAVFTNLTQDHLDYHQTMARYFSAKAKLFQTLAPQKESPKYAVINLDDEWSGKLRGLCPTGVTVLTYSLNQSEASVWAEDLHYTIHGASLLCHTPQGQVRLQLKIAGQFGVYNALAALTTALALSIPLETIKLALESVTGIRGRFELVNNSPAVIVDYAHTPDGLKNVLQAARMVTPKDSRLIVVFGCGGDRDATKRPKMGHIAETLADNLIITSDNPRSEDPQQIMTDIASGIERFDPTRMIMEPDRQTAIHRAINMSKPTDIIVIAGKGHEDYQILADRTIHFDDKEVVAAYMQKLQPQAH
jgi:UDP-N-acetylmuramoyl-L-alanyl-D-glutamate--2,6-diaminopimelate ligase